MRRTCASMNSSCHWISQVGTFSFRLFPSAHLSLFFSHAHKHTHSLCLPPLLTASHLSHFSNEKFYLLRKFILYFLVFFDSSDSLSSLSSSLSMPWHLHSSHRYIEKWYLARDECFQGKFHARGRKAEKERERERARESGRENEECRRKDLTIFCVMANLLILLNIFAVILHGFASRNSRNAHQQHHFVFMISEWALDFIWFLAKGTIKIFYRFFIS